MASSCWGLEDFPSAIAVEETGSTFQQNAALKAVEQAKQIGQWVLGEDSGISVEHLMAPQASIQPALQANRPVTNPITHAA